MNWCVPYLDSHWIEVVFCNICHGFRNKSLVEFESVSEILLVWTHNSPLWLMMVTLALIKVHWFSSGWTYRRFNKSTKRRSIASNLCKLKCFSRIFSFIAQCWWVCNFFLTIIEFNSRDDFWITKKTRNLSYDVYNSLLSFKFYFHSTFFANGISRSSIPNKLFTPFHCFSWTIKQQQLIHLPAQLHSVCGNFEKHQIAKVAARLKIFLRKSIESLDIVCNTQFTIE